MKKIIVNCDDIYRLNFRFNGKEIPLYHFINSYKKRNSNLNQMVEILPSVYCNEMSNTLEGLHKLLYQIMIFLNVKKEDYVITVKNIRDDFCIVGTDTEENECPQIEKVGIENTYIQTDLLPYPGMLGGGCWMWSLFSKINLLNGSAYDLYTPLTEAQVLKVTENCKLLNEKICRNSRCEEFIKKMIDGTFVPIYADTDSENAIYIESTDNHIKLIEGKHRVCAAKRFGMKEIPVTICHYTIMNAVNEREWYDDLQLYATNHDVCFEILKKCYKIYNEIGLEDNEIRELNESVNDDKFINFLEVKTGKSILAILGLEK